MTVDEFVCRFPTVFHMAEEGTWPSIQRYGLKSASAILDLLDVPAAPRAAIEAHRRPASVTLLHPAFGRWVIRDNKALNEVVLSRCLRDGMRPADWYRALNRRCFFWCSRDRLVRVLGARAYRGRTHDVLVVGSRQLLARHAGSVELARIITGCARYSAPGRGAATFVPLAAAPPAGWTPVELVVPYEIGDIAECVLRVDRMAGAEATTIWSRPAAGAEPDRGPARVAATA